MNYVMLIILAIVVSSIIVLAFVMPRLHENVAKFKFEYAYKLKDTLLSEGGFTLSENVYVDVKPLTVCISGITLKLTRVYIIFRVDNSPILEPSLSSWSVWGNGTHAGIASGITVSDNGIVVKITYINSTTGYTRHVHLSGGVSIEKILYIENGKVFSGEAIYEWRGYRIVQICSYNLKT